MVPMYLELYREDFLKWFLNRWNLGVVSILNLGERENRWIWNFFSVAGSSWLQGKLTCCYFLEYEVAKCTTLIFFFFSIPLLAEPWTWSSPGQSWLSWILFSSSTSEEVGLICMICSLRTSCPLVYRKPLPRCLPAPGLPQPDHQ